MIHVTRVSNDGVFGHTTDHCDQAGCAGDEHYFKQVSPDLVEAGQVVNVSDAGEITVEA